MRILWESVSSCGIYVCECECCTRVPSPVDAWPLAVSTPVWRVAGSPRGREQPAAGWGYSGLRGGGWVGGWGSCWGHY